MRTRRPGRSGRRRTPRRCSRRRTGRPAWRRATRSAPASRRSAAASTRSRRRSAKSDRDAERARGRAARRRRRAHVGHEPERPRDGRIGGDRRNEAVEAGSGHAGRRGPRRAVRRRSQHDRVAVAPAPEPAVRPDDVEAAGRVDGRRGKRQRAQQRLLGPASAARCRPAARTWRRRRATAPHTSPVHPRGGRRSARRRAGRAAARRPRRRRRPTSRSTGAPHVAPPSFDVSTAMRDTAMSV